MKGKHGQYLPQNILGWLINRYSGNTYLPNLFEYFISRGLELLNKDGLFAFIIPDRFGLNSVFSGLRKKILMKFKLIEIIYKWNFPGIITDTMTFIICNTSENQNYTLNISEKPNLKKITFKRDELLSNDNIEFKAYSSKEIKDLIVKIKMSGIDLIKISETTSGFGGNQNYFQTKEPL